MQTQILEVPLSRVVVRDRIRQDYGDLKSLADSIQAHGLMQPIGIDPNYRLVFGERKLASWWVTPAEKTALHLKLLEIRDAKCRG